jgi:hypothetical protein
MWITERTTKQKKHKHSDKQLNAVRNQNKHRVKHNTNTLNNKQLCMQQQQSNAIHLDQNNTRKIIINKQNKYKNKTINIILSIANSTPPRAQISPSHLLKD